VFQVNDLGHLQRVHSTVTESHADGPLEEAMDRALIVGIIALTGVLADRLVSPKRFVTPAPPAASVRWRDQPAPAESVSDCVRRWSAGQPACDFGPLKLVWLEP
jgi:hypothetical protein